MTLVRSRSALAGVLAAAGIAAVASPAQAQVTANAAAIDVQPSTGTTTLSLDKSMKKRLKRDKVKASGTSYKVVGGTFNFSPVAAGGGGTLIHIGTLKFKKKRKTARLSNFTLTVSRTPTGGTGLLTAVVNGKGTPAAVATLDFKAYGPTEYPAGFAGLRVKLSSAGAKALNKALKTKAFKRGRRLGTLKNTSQAPIRFTGGLTKFTVDPGLAAAGVGVAPLAGTTGTGTAAAPFQFAVTGGTLDLAAFLGAGIQHSGGIRITVPGRNIDVVNPVIRYDPTKGYVMRSGSIDVLSLQFEAGSEYGVAPQLLFVVRAYFTREVAELVAPAIKRTPAQVEQLPLGVSDTLANYAKAG